MSTDSIGSAGGRDWANLADWFAAIPSTLVENEIGEVYNDSEFIMTSGVDFSGKTPGAFTIILRPAAGEGFADNLTKLSYDATQGAAFSSSSGYVVPLIYSRQDEMIIEGLQFKTSALSSYVYFTENISSNHYTKNCIMDCNGSAKSVFVLGLAKVINCLGIQRRGDGYGSGVGYGGIAINCVVVAPNGVTPSGNIGFSAGGGSNVVKNCASFGFATAFSTGWSGTSDYNAADDATAPGSNSLQNLTYANQFVSTTDDWRLKSGADLIDTGNTDATDAPNDIIGTVRGLTTDGDIGCWEYVVAALGWGRLLSKERNRLVVHS